MIIYEGRCGYYVGGLFDLLFDIPNDECVVFSNVMQLVALYEYAQVTYSRTELMFLSVGAPSIRTSGLTRFDSRVFIISLVNIYLKAPISV